MFNHPGTPISIYEIAELVGTSYPLAFTPTNIQSGFRVSGISPFNRDIFSDDEFLSSYVTDRNDPAGVPGGRDSGSAVANVSGDGGRGTSAAANVSGDGGGSTSKAANVSGDGGGGTSAVANVSGDGSGGTSAAANVSGDGGGSTSAAANVSGDVIGGTSSTDIVMECSEEGTSTAFISPTKLRPFLKAGPRKTLGGRRKGSTRILTDSPIKAVIEEDAKRRSDVKNKRIK